MAAKTTLRWRGLSSTVPACYLRRIGRSQNGMARGSSVPLAGAACRAALAGTGRGGSPGGAGAARSAGGRCRAAGATPAGLRPGRGGRAAGWIRRCPSRRSAGLAGPPEVARERAGAEPGRRRRASRAAGPGGGGAGRAPGRWSRCCWSRCRRRLLPVPLAPLLGGRSSGGGVRPGRCRPRACSGPGPARRPRRRGWPPAPGSPSPSAVGGASGRNREAYASPAAGRPGPGARGGRPTGGGRGGRADPGRHAGRNGRGLARVAPRPPGRPVAGHAGNGHAGGVHRVPAEGEARLAQAVLGPFGRAEGAVADGGEQVGERLAVDEHGHRDQRDHQDLQRPRQHRVGRAHDERIAVQQHAQHDRDRDLLHQHADQHLEPADGDDPAEARMGADDQEERPGHQQQQEAELEHDQGQRDEQDEQPGHQRGEHRGERDLQPGRPLVALEQRSRCRDCSAAGRLAIPV